MIKRLCNYVNFENKVTWVNEPSIQLYNSKKDWEYVINRIESLVLIFDEMLEKYPQSIELIEATKNYRRLVEYASKEQLRYEECYQYVDSKKRSIHNNYYQTVGIRISPLDDYGFITQNNGESVLVNMIYYDMWHDKTILNRDKLMFKIIGDKTKFLEYRIQDSSCDYIFDANTLNQLMLVRK